MRPTSDKVREAIFDVLAAALPDGFGGRAIDLFAGTGALGIEALSRGVGHAVFVEKDPAAASIITENLARTGFEGRGRVMVVDAERAVPLLRSGSEGAFSLAFLDPPYGAASASGTASLLVSQALLAPDGIIVIESGARQVPAPPTGLQIFRHKRYGDTVVAFLRRAVPSPEAGRNSESKTALEAEPEA